LRNEELERGHGAPWANDTRELAERCGRIIDVAQEVRDREAVEAAVRERHRFGTSLDEVDPAGESCSFDSTSTLGKHLRALVDPDDVAAVASSEPDRDRSRAGRDVDDGLAGGGRDTRDEKAPPKGVLPEAEERRIPIVRRRERGEQPCGQAVPLGARWHHVSIVAAVGLREDLSSAATAAEAFIDPGEELAAVIAAEPATGLRLYLCAYRREEDLKWLALDAEGQPVADRALVKDSVAIVGMCELAEESAGGGDVQELRRQLADLRIRENPEGIDEAEAAAASLQETLAPAPRVASVEYLDRVGAAATRLELSLGEVGSSPFARAMTSGHGAVDALAKDVTQNYKRPLG
jgi:hypothetical protein